MRELQKPRATAPAVVYLQIKALAAFHDLSTGKAANAGVLATVFYFVPVIILLAAVIGVFMLDMGQETGTAVEQAAFLLEIHP